MISLPGYKIIQPIGQGGMATVYLATQESVEREVAIKVMSPSLTSDPSFSERFIKEARMASLVHPHIITVFDAGEVDGQNYIVMEYVNGGNLATLIKQGISIRRAVEIICQIASALHYSAKKGFIHRDVKPENILFREDGSAVLVDFGIAKAISSGTRLTTVGTTIGSPNYMSPEQTRGQELDGRSDLYSLGIVFYETLTGAKPFDASDTFAIGLKHLNEPVPQLPRAYAVFQPIIDRLLAKNPDDRFENGENLIEALSQIDLDLAEAMAAASTAEENDKTRILVRPNDATVVISKTGQKKNILPGVTITLIILIFTAAGYWYLKKPIESPPEPVAVLIPEIKPQPQLSEPEAEPQPGIAIEPIKQIPEPVIEEITELPAVNLEQTINTLLEKARNAIDHKRYTTPENNNALAYFNQVLTLDKNNIPALQGISELSDKYLAMAELQFQQKKYTNALRLIDKGLSINKDNAALLALQSKINNLLLAKKEIPTTETKMHQSILSKDEHFAEFTGIHVGSDPQIVNWFARQDLVNLIYNIILQQCNNSDDGLNNSECINNYTYYLKQWPMPVLAASYSQSGEVATEIKGQYQFNRTKIKQTYQAALDSFQNQYKQALKNNFSDKADLIALANYNQYTAIISLLGLNTTADLNQTLKNTINSWRLQTPVIKNKTELLDKISYMLGKKVHIRPFVSHNSFEITPFAYSLQQLFTQQSGNTAIYAANRILHGEYSLNPDGSLNLDLWLFDDNGKVIAIESLLLAKEITDGDRYAAIFYNDTFLPLNHLKQSYGFPAEISIAEQTSNALLITGEQASLKVKLDRSGFYFIAVHVKRKDDEYSYLLPLHIAQVPFVQVTTSAMAKKFISLGEFKISPPLGVEALQLIAASVNLEKYLPAYHWDETRKQYVIDGSIGNIAKGIAQVRTKANQISANSHENGIRWQERLLITTILNPSRFIKNHP